MLSSIWHYYFFRNNYIKFEMIVKGVSGKSGFFLIELPIVLHPSPVVCACEKVEAAACASGSEHSASTPSTDLSMWKSSDRLPKTLLGFRIAYNKNTAT